MKEIWKPIEGYEGRYEVSNIGRVRSLDRIISFKSSNKYRSFESSYMKKGRILVPVKHKNGYSVVKIEGKIIGIHRLVAETFVQNPYNKQQVNHIDGNKQNNNAENLEWVTQSENTIHAYKNDLVKHKVVAVKQYDLQGNYIRTWNSIKSASEELGANASKISDCCRGARKTTHGFKWEYVNGGYKNDEN